MKFISWLAILTWFAFVFNCVSTLEWIVDDAIYVSAEIEIRSPDESYNGSSVAEEVSPGRCKKFRECYPLLFFTDRNDLEPTSINSALTDFILDTSDTCLPTDQDASIKNSSEKGDMYIWCPARKFLSHAPTITRPAVLELKAEGEEGNCGSSKFLQESPEGGPSQRVVGGQEISPGEAPYAVDTQTVAMTYKGKQVCGGSLIDDSYVLTAAHCVSHLKPSALLNLRLLVGDHDITDPTDVEHQERNVSKVIYHKDFSKETLHDDVAMIRLSEPVPLSGSISAICMSDGNPPYDDGSTFAKLVGWGQLSEMGARPLTPRAADLRIWKQDECEEVYDGITPEEVLEKAFCAGGFQEDGTTDACRGDSGGPISILRNNRLEQVGIVSFGVGCGRYPGVFTRVNEYQGWIDRHRARIVE